MWWEHNKSHILELKRTLSHTSCTDMSQSEEILNEPQVYGSSNAGTVINTAAECSQSLGTPIMQILSMHEVTQ